MTPPGTSAEAVAIVGMAGRFPGAADIDQFWRNLQGGVESISVFKDEDLQWSPLNEPSRANDSRLVKARAFLEDPEGFDAAFFNINPKEAELMDPQHRVFLELAWAALESAGCNPDAVDGLIGVYAGSNQNSYLLWNLAVHGDILRRYGAFQNLLAGEKDFLPARVSYKLNLRGPSIDVQSGCSTSLVAISLAAQSLLTYQCDLALAGGVSIAYPQNQGWIYEEGGILSPDGHCRSFDAAAAGFVPGDGAGIVVLKRLSEALADGDRVWAVIKGSAVNNDGSRKIGFTAPSIDGQAEVIALAQAAAGVDPETISYIEAHGTATPLGDPIEFAGIAKAFSESAAKVGSCAIGSVKSNIGHLDAAAGVAGLIKTVLALRHGQLPPTLHYGQPNPEIPFAGSPFYVNDRLREWASGSSPRRAGVSSFGIGGTNAHVVLEEAPAVAPENQARLWQPLLLSAHTETALAAMSQRLADHLEGNPDISFADALFTLQTGRQRFVHRLALACRSRAEAVAALRTRSRSVVRTSQTREKDPPLAFLFPGVGVQVVGMGRELYRTEPVFRETVDRCCGILRAHLQFDLRGVIYPDLASQAPRNGAPVQAIPPTLERTIAAQPALFVIEYALAQLWMNWGVRPQAMLGHSLGEYVAACLAGVFSLEDGLAIVAARARLIEEQPAGAMIAVRLNEKDLTSLLPDGVSIAAVNAPNQCVASGSCDSIEVFSARLAKAGTAFRRLPVSHAFHSRMLEGAARQLVDHVRKLKLQAPQIPYLSNVTGRWISAGEATDPNYWGEHLLRTVRFADGMAELGREPSRVFLEVGPGQTLGPLARASGKSEHAVISSLESKSVSGDAASIADAVGRLWIAGLTIDWRRFHAEAKRLKVPLPTYPFEHKRFRIGGVENDRAAVAAHPNGNQPPAQPVRKRENHLAAVKALFQELSGVDLSEVSPAATFLELGFDSLFLTQAVRAVQNRFEVAITFRQLFEEFSTLEKLAARLDSHKGTAAATESSPESRKSEPKIASARARVVPLTEAQREIWFASQIDPRASAAFNQTCILRLRGPIDSECLGRAVAQLVERHESLRITVEPAGERQTIAPSLEIDVPFFDSAGLSETAAEVRAMEVISRELEQPFDLSRGPLVRARLFRLAERHHLFVLILHHIICDGWSLGLLAVELGELYTAALAGEAPSNQEAAKFSAFAERQAAQGESDEFAAAQAHWLAQFSESIPMLELPTDRLRSTVRTYSGAQRAHVLSPSAVAAVRRASAQCGCTSFAFLFSVFSVLLHRLSGQDDIVVGVPAAAQIFDGDERLAGHCVNLLPIRSRLEDGRTFAEYLALTRETMWTAFEHWRYPFGRLLRMLKVSRDQGRAPLINATFNLGRVRGNLSFAGVDTEIVVSPKPFVTFDLGFDFTETDNTLILDCRYSTELFDETTIERLVARYEALLETIAADPGQAIATLPLLSNPEKRQVLVDWNETRSPYPRQACVHHLFAEQVERSPEAIAIVGESERLTYRELDRRAERLAQQLRGLGIGPDSLVGILMPRTPRLVTAVFAVLKAGGAYVPLDPDYPASRLETIAVDARPSLILIEHGLADRLPTREFRVLCLDDQGEPRQKTEKAGKIPAIRAPEATDLAYVIYTSGSTGGPKGVAVEHRSIAALIDWARRLYSAEELAGVLASTSICFDLSVFELFVPLCTGGKVILAENVLQLKSLRAAAQVTLINTVPSAMHELLRSGSLPASVCTINLAGEPLSQSLVEQLYQMPGIGRVYDLYGPTEDTVYSTCALRRPGGRANIGRPLAHKRAYILDRHLQPVPVGAPGELYLGGVGLARGYLHRPELTAEKFIPDPFSNGSGARLYRTGDLVRYGSDGAIEFLGRLDHQIKLRGYRIELEEIESIVRNLPGVSACAVLLREDRPGDKRLVAYAAIPADASFGASDIRRALRDKLPSHMVPSVFVILPRLPMTPNGKVDRKVLPAPEEDRADGLDLRPGPQTSAEKTLSEIWCEVLGVSRVSRDDNFFDLGGHSLLAMQLLTRVEESFAVTLHLRSVFEEPVLARLASLIENAVILSISQLDDETAQLAVENMTMGAAETLSLNLTTHANTTDLQ